MRSGARPLSCFWSLGAWPMHACPLDGCSCLSLQGLDCHAGKRACDDYKGSRGLEATALSRVCRGHQASSRRWVDAGLRGSWAGVAVSIGLCLVCGPDTQQDLLLPALHPSCHDQDCDSGDKVRLQRGSVSIFIRRRGRPGPVDSGARGREPGAGSRGE